MKKLLLVFLFLSMIVGCSNKSYEESQKEDPTYNEIGDNKDTLLNQDWYTTFESSLTDQEISYDSKTPIDGTTIGATEGYRYAVKQYGNVDIYRYDDGADFDKVLKNKKVTIDGKEKNVEINDHYVIVSDGLDNNILDLFRGQ